MNYTRRLYGASGSSTNDLAHIDITTNSYLTGIDIEITPTAVTSSDAVYVEISTASLSQSATNDAQGILASAGFAYFMTTSGAVMPSVNHFVGPIMLPLKAGQRVYMHTIQAGTDSTRCRAQLHLTSA